MNRKKHLEKLAELDKRLVGLATGVKLLSQLSWPAQVQQAFFAARSSG